MQIQVIRGAAIAPHMEELADLRIQVFREWPYLYDGTIDYERRYLTVYLNCAQSVVVLAQSEGRLVGASTALPLCAAAEEFQAAFKLGEYQPDEVFYFGESVLLPEFRGQGAGRRFFQEREQAATAHGFRHAAFCAVDRYPEDPRRLSGYRELADFWTSLGYQKQPDMQARLSWPELGQNQASENTLTFWIKAL